MKKRIICGVLLCSTIFSSIVSYASENIEIREDKIQNASYEESDWVINSNQYDYPICGNDEEWSEFNSHDEMVAACNAPEEVLKEATTEELVELMLKYPLLGDIMLFDNVNDGFEVLSQNSNILAELLERENGATALLNAYCESKICTESALSVDIIEEVVDNPVVITEIISDDKNQKIIEEEGNNIVENTFLESVLVQEEVIEQLNDEELDILAEEAAEKAVDKRDSELYSSYEDTIYEVAQETNQLDVLGDVEISKASNSDIVYGNDVYTTVKTPKGSKVQVIKRTYSASESSLAYNYTIKYYPNVVVLAGATTNYNCHSYAWYSQNTGTNKYWMDNPSAYVTDGSYKKVGSRPTAKNQKVCYMQYPLSNPYVHSGIVEVISGSTVVLKSKWGAGPLVRHNANYSPYGGTLVYYKK